MLCPHLVCESVAVAVNGPPDAHVQVEAERPEPAGEGGDARQVPAYKLSKL